MGRGYDAAAEAARDRGVIEKRDLQEWQVKAQMQKYLQSDKPNSSGYQKLVDKTTEAAMNQEVRDAYGHNAGKRENITAWEDTHGNIMRHNTETGNRSKLVDSEDR